MKLKIRKTYRRKRRNTRNITRRRQKGGNGLEVFYDNQKVAGQELSKSITQTQPSIKALIHHQKHIL